MICWLEDAYHKYNDTVGLYFFKWSLHVFASAIIADEVTIKSRNCSKKPSFELPISKAEYNICFF